MTSGNLTQFSRSITKPTNSYNQQPDALLTQGKDHITASLFQNSTSLLNSSLIENNEINFRNHGSNTDRYIDFTTRLEHPTSDSTISKHNTINSRDSNDSSPQFSDYINLQFNPLNKNASHFNFDQEKPLRFNNSRSINKKSSNEDLYKKDVHYNFSDIISESEAPENETPKIHKLTANRHQKPDFRGYSSPEKKIEATSIERTFPLPLQSSLQSVPNSENLNNLYQSHQNQSFNQSFSSTSSFQPSPKSSMVASLANASTPLRRHLAATKILEDSIGTRTFNESKKSINNETNQDVNKNDHSANEQNSLLSETGLLTLTKEIQDVLDSTHLDTEVELHNENLENSSLNQAQDTNIHSKFQFQTLSEISNQSKPKNKSRTLNDIPKNEYQNFQNYQNTYNYDSQRKEHDILHNINKINNKTLLIEKSLANINDSSLDIEHRVIASKVKSKSEKSQNTVFTPRNRIFNQSSEIGIPSVTLSEMNSSKKSAEILNSSSSSSLDSKGYDLPFNNSLIIHHGDEYEKDLTNISNFLPILLDSEQEGKNSFDKSLISEMKILQDTRKDLLTKLKSLKVNEEYLLNQLRENERMTEIIWNDIVNGLDSSLKN